MDENEVDEFLGWLVTELNEADLEEVAVMIESLDERASKNSEEDDQTATTRVALALGLLRSQLVDRLAAEDAVAQWFEKKNTVVRIEPHKNARSADPTVERADEMSRVRNLGAIIAAWDRVVDAARELGVEERSDA